MATRKTAAQKAAEAARQAKEAEANDALVRLATLKRRREVAEDRLSDLDIAIREAEEALKPIEPEPVDGNPCPVITFTKDYARSSARHLNSNHTYSYAAIRINGAWYITQNSTGNVPSMHWPRLLEWLGKSNWPSILVMQYPPHPEDN